MLSASESNLLTAFKKSHRGYSIDAVICTDRLRQEFLSAAERTNPGTCESDLLWNLLNIRKRSELGSVSFIRTNMKHEQYEYAAQRAANLIHFSNRIEYQSIEYCATAKKEQGLIKSLRKF